MCYSISIYSDIKTLIRRFSARPPTSLSLPRYYYISAFSFPKIPVIANNEPELIQAFRWGLVPYWVRDGKKAREIRKKTINARFETLHQRPAFKRAFQEQRCLIIVDGFFEFREVGGRKVPYFLRLKSGEPFALGGLWDTWRDPATGLDESTFSIVTVPANDMLSMIHNTKKRMPMILAREKEKAWLARPLEKGEVADMEKRFNQRILEAYPVSRQITSKGVDSSRPELLHPHDYPELEGI